MEVRHFPFGQPLKKVCQIDRTPKQAFVLGVYASAVHACWVNPQGKIKVKALAVASEPYIFWTGEESEKYFPQIHPGLGKLIAPTDKNLNGPSGRALDKLFLTPLGFKRETSWLCDLLPESRVNSNQKYAIDREYTKAIIEQYKLKPATVPLFDKMELDSSSRRHEILAELESSGAETLILLGDLPIYWFLRFYTEERYSKLAQFGETENTYGMQHKIKINGKSYNVIPLCHPRQADSLGKANAKWRHLHDQWIEKNSISGF